jgi:hypothetical protein
MDDISIDGLLDLLESHKKYWGAEHVMRLAAMLPGHQPADEVTGAVILGNLMEEVQAQMAYLKNFRRSVTAKGNGASSREIKDMIQSSTTLFTMLTKMQMNITNQDRLAKIEEATVSAIRTLSTELQQQFFRDLELALAL